MNLFTTPKCSTSLSESLPAQLGADLRQIGRDLEETLKRDDLGITLLPKTGRITEASLRAQFPAGPIVCCDFYLEEIENGEEHQWGYVKNEIINIDHHAPTRIMTGPISSGVQASLYIAERGKLPSETPVIINHTDCDSIIAAAIMRGLIPPHPAFSRAVIAADHTSAADPIADMLQPLEPSQNLRLCLAALAAVLSGESLAEECVPYLQRSEAEKRIAARAFEMGKVKREGEAAMLLPDEQVESSFVTPLFPEAAVVITASLMRKQPSEGQPLWNIKLRLGQAAPPDLTLYGLGVFDFDPKFGGRWNAGSTSRSGGTTKTPGEYLEFLAARLARL